MKPPFIVQALESKKLRWAGRIIQEFDENSLWKAATRKNEKEMGV
jgi:hypothetical protein